MNLRNVRSLGLTIALCTAAAGPFLANCAAPVETEEELTEDAVTGVNNPLGLGLAYDAETGQVQAGLKDSLKQGEVLRIRVRRGTLTTTSQKELKCDELSEAKPMTGAGSRDLAALGKVTYRGPKVSAELVALKDLYDDHRWQSDSDWSATQTAAMKAAGGPHAIIEACIMKGSAVRAKLQTHLALAWDEGNAQAKAAKKLSAGIIGFRADAGAGEGGEPEPETDAGAPAPRLNEADRMNSMEKYAELCVQELGEIPFFKKLSNGKYDTYDCRDFASTGEGRDAQKIDGVEGAMIPLTADDRPVNKCDRKKGSSSYNCVDKCDKAEYLSEGCEPGPTVSTAKNAQGTHWVLLCRKVDPRAEVGEESKAKRFDDIAMIGHNPKTGRTCFFQNSIGSGNDGEHITHPADVEKSRAIWDSPKGYCNESCHTAKPFIHSPWIDGALRQNGKPIVPKMGEHPDFEVSWADAPYYITNMDAQGWTIPKQLVSDEASACASCHRIGGGDAWLREFANWTTGKGERGGEMNDRYWKKITDTYKQFEKSHWMPPRLDGTTADNWEASKWGQSMTHINKCQANRNDPSCIWENVPRGPANPARPNP